MTRTNTNIPLGPQSEKIAKIMVGVIVFYGLLYFLTPFVYQECSTRTQQNIYFIVHNSISYSVIFVLFFLISAIWYAKSIKNSKSNLGKIIKTLFLIIVLLLTFGIFWIMVFPYSWIGGGRAHLANSVNLKRTYDIRSIGVALMQYYEDNETYPTNLNLLVPSYIQKIPEDPISKQAYEYMVSGNSKDYVIKSNLNSFAPGCYSQVTLAPLARKLQKIDLGYDLDGTVYGVDCNDPAYCKGPEQFK